MEFAINFSQPAAELLAEGAIRVDRFKAPDWPDLIEAAGKFAPVYVHFAINAGADDSRTTDWRLADDMARRTGTPFVNLHLAPRAKDFAVSDQVAVIDRLMADVERAVAFFGADRVIVENVPLGNPQEGFAPECADPGIIAQIIERTGCGFLLDLSHARLTARQLGRDERQYISSLPVERIRELHLTGLEQVDGRLRDHMPMSDPDWEITEWVFAEVRRGHWSAPKIVAFEYGGVGEGFAWRTDRDVIERQVPRHYDLVHD